MDAKWWIEKFNTADVAIHPNSSFGQQFLKKMEGLIAERDQLQAEVEKLKNKTGDY